MDTSDEYKDDIASFASYEESVINDEGEWNIDDIIRNVSADFIIIQENEWNSYIDSISERQSMYNDKNTDDGQKFGENVYIRNEFLPHDDNADGSNASTRIQQYVDNNLNWMLMTTLMAGTFPHLQGP